MVDLNPMSDVFDQIDDLERIGTWNDPDVEGGLAVIRHDVRLGSSADGSDA